MQDRPGHMFPVGRPVGKMRRFPGWAVVGIFLILLFMFIAQARAFLMPATLALLLFFVFSPFRRLMARVGVGPTGTAAIVSLGLVVGVGGIAWIVSGPVNTLIDNAPQISQQLESRMRDLRQSFSVIEQAAARIDELTSGGPGNSAPENANGGTPDATLSGTLTTEPTADNPEPPQQRVEVQVTSNDSSALLDLASFGPAVIGQAIFTLFLLFFLISSGDLLYLKIVQSFNTLREKRAAYMALREIEDSLGAYLSAITLINACLGIATGIAMWSWGMPSPILFGVAAFTLNFIPYLGPITGVAISALVALLAFDNLLTPLLVAGTYLTLTSIEGQLITPYFVSRRLQLNTVVVFLTVALWAWLWSVIGMIVAVPLLVVMRVLADHIPGLSKFGNFLAGEAPPALEDEDEEEARDLVRAGATGRDADEAAPAVDRVDGDTATDESVTGESITGGSPSRG